MSILGGRGVWRIQKQKNVWVQGGLEVEGGAWIWSKHTMYVCEILKEWV